MNQAASEIALPDADTPLHERLAQAIAAMIEDGRYKPGERLPTHRELARRAGVAIGTVTKAVDVLSNRGLVRGEVGRGTFINAIARPQRATQVDLTLNVPPLLIDEALFIAAAERSARKVLGVPSGGLYDLKGTLAQRTILAGWLGRTRLDADPAELMLCVGAQQAIHLSFADLKRHSRSIACEAATFSGAIAAAAHLDLAWQPVEHDGEGMLPDELDRVLEETGCRAIYATPVCQNPLGFEVGEARRRQIIQIAEKHDAYIVEDDIYGIYSVRGRPTYKELAPGRVYYLTSLSKCLTPLARVGVLVPPEDRLAPLLRALRAEVFGAPPTALELGCALIELGADVVAAQALRKEAGIRTAMASRILGLSSLPMPEGAPHLWLPMPAMDAERLARRSSEHGVRLTPPDATSVGAAQAGGVRLCILAPAERDDMERALKTVARLLADTEDETVV
ncbi:PLP-dependent aminotransferase family protein [Verticiella sediminum]|nr:PLP-dependent aminotransferase family protein [Verticiella sediminum]